MTAQKNSQFPREKKMSFQKSCPEEQPIHALELSSHKTNSPLPIVRRWYHILFV